MRALAHDPDRLAEGRDLAEGPALSERGRAMVSYALALTRAPHAISEADVDGLRAVGFADAAILDICQVVAYYNYVNRLVDGLGVELESSWEGRELTMTRAEFEGRRSRRHGTHA